MNLGVFETNLSIKKEDVVYQAAEELSNKVLGALLAEIASSTIPDMPYAHQQIIYAAARRLNNLPSNTPRTD